MSSSMGRSSGGSFNMRAYTGRSSGGGVSVPVQMGRSSGGNPGMPGSGGRSGSRGFGTPGSTVHPSGGALTIQASPGRQFSTTQGSVSGAAARHVAGPPPGRQNLPSHQWPTHAPASRAWDHASYFPYPYGDLNHFRYPSHSASVVIVPFWYPFGYSHFFGPYYASYGYDYGTPYLYQGMANYGSYPLAAEPLVASAAPVQETPEQTTTEQSGTLLGEQYYADGLRAFRTGDYRDAVRLANHAAVEMPQNPKVHELMSLALLALADYRDAAMEAHAALALGPASDWPTLYAYYGNVETYTNQFRALEQFSEDNPSSAEAHFLLGYHDLMTGHRAEAKEQLSEVVKLAPADKLAQELLKKL